MFNISLAGVHLYRKNAVHLAVAGDVCGGVFYGVLFPTRFMDEIRDLIELNNHLYIYVRISPWSFCGEPGLVDRVLALHA